MALAAGIMGAGSFVFAAEKPNIVLFLVDDMGLMDTSQPFLAGKDGRLAKQPLNDFYRTPGMVRLAKTGTLFSCFYANSVCSPTRTTILNGQSSARHHVTQWINPYKKNSGPKGWNWKGLKPGDVTLPGLLKEAGYKTIFCGKAHLGPFKSEGVDPTNLGFDVNIGGSAIGQPGSYYGEKNYGKGGSHPVPHLEKYHGTKTFLTEALTLEVNKEIDKAKAEKKPFFVEMSHYALHAPFHSDPRFADNYKDSGKNARAQAYATLVEGMDKSLRDMLDHLEKIGEAENTIVIFLGDNGSDAPLGRTHSVGSSAPIRGKKGTHYEGGMRVPFIMSWAKPSAGSALQKKFPINPGAVTDDFASICDIFPTALEAAEVEAPKSHIVDGQSIASYLENQKGENKQTFLMHFPHSHRSSYFTVYRDGDWKIVYHYAKPQGKRVELFNLAKDPYEAKNMAATETQRVSEMLKQMQAALDEAGAQYAVHKDGKPMRIEH
ncbi:sulfatase-like hydrolase/transferase [Rubritalea tangerina]